MKHHGLTRHLSISLCGVCWSIAQGQAVFSQVEFENAASATRVFSSECCDLTIGPSTASQRNGDGGEVLYSYDMAFRTTGTTWHYDSPLCALEVLVGEDGRIFAWAYETDFQGRRAVSEDGTSKNGSIVVFCVSDGAEKWKVMLPRGGERIEFNPPLSALPIVAGFTSQADQGVLSIYLASSREVSDDISVQRIKASNGDVLGRDRLASPRTIVGKGVWSCRQVRSIPRTPYDFIYYSGMVGEKVEGKDRSAPQFVYSYGAAFVIYNPAGETLWSSLCPRLYTENASPAELKEVDQQGHRMPLPWLDGSAIVVPVGNKKQGRIVVSRSQEGNDVVQVDKLLECR